MQNTKSARNSNTIYKKLLATVSIGVFAIAPLLGATAADAKPKKGHAPAWNQRNQQFRTIEGVVVNDRKGNDFDLRLNNGQTIRVDVKGHEPRRLSRGDRVRVYGKLDGKKFKASNVAVVRNVNKGNENNRNNNNNDNWSNGNNNNNRNNSYGTFTGIVGNVDSNDRFDLKVGGQTYNVKLSRNAPRRLNRNDTVRVYGVRSGNNGITNASVVIVNNNSNNGNWNNNGNNNNNSNDYRTFTGVVRNVDSNDRFDLKAGGQTYNVKLSRNAPRRLNRNDTVRVYGVRSGNNDITNANVVIVTNR